MEVDGFRVHDTPASSRVHARGTLDPTLRLDIVTNAREVESLLHQPDVYEFSINLLAWDDADEIERAVDSLVAHRDDRSIEIVLIDNGSSDGTAEVVEQLAREHPEVHPVWIDHWVGEGAGRNVGLLRSQGRIVIVLGNHIEVTGDIFTPIAAVLRDLEVGLVGGWGVRSGELRDFESSAGPEVDAVEAYLLAFRRAEIDRVGLFDEKFRFYRHIDLEYSAASEDEVALAGKGFNPQVEESYKPKHAELDFSKVDGIEKFKIPEEELIIFIRNGGLDQP